jgi:hypothetical protein
VAHANLYGVTATLKELLRVNIWRLSGQIVTVSDLPPEDAEEETGTRLNLHLYHAVEDPSRRNNLPINDAGPYPISRAPLPLTLYYALTAHSSTGGSQKDPAQAQFLMGLAMKSFHDFPVVDDRLTLPGPPVGLPLPILDPQMRGAQNRLGIVQRQTTPEESVSFWSAAQNHTARLTAFYEVRSFLMPTEADTEKLPLVAAMALGVTQSARATLTATTSVQTLTLPALSGGATLSSPVSPAVAVLGATSAPAGNHVTLIGTGVGDGNDIRILLATPAFAALVPPLEEAAIDPGFNPPWKFKFTPTGVEFDVQPAASAEAPEGSVALTIRPGLYSIGIRRLNQLKTEAGATSTAAIDSNRLPFAVGAAIDTAVPIGTRLRFTLMDGIDCTDPLNKPQLSIGGDVYQFVTALSGDPAADAGKFIAHSPTAYEAEPRFDAADGGTRMVRLTVNGVDAPPFWLEP